jgi:hypothetical protein
MLEDLDIDILSIEKVGISCGYFFWRLFGYPSHFQTSFLTWGFIFRFHLHWPYVGISVTDIFLTMHERLGP